MKNMFVVGSKFIGLCAFALLLPGLEAATYGVVAGVGQYNSDSNSNSSLRNLQFPAVDAQAIYGVLLGEAGRAEPTHLRLFRDGEATRKDVLDAIEKWLPARVTAADSVVVYLAGHGHLEGNAGFFLPHGFDEKAIPATSIPMAQVFRALAALPAKSVLLLTDACHSGAINGEAQVGALRKIFAAAHGNVISIAASRLDQSALETLKDNEQHTLFGGYVIRGLTGAADADCNGETTALELARYVALVERETEGRQQPSVSIAPRLEQTVVARVDKRFCDASQAGFGQATLTLSGFTANVIDESAVVILDGVTVATAMPGAVRLRGLRAGTHQLQVHQLRSAGQARTIRIANGAEEQIEVKLEPHATPPAAQTLLDRAREKYRKNNLAQHHQAVELLRRAQALAPEDPEVHFQTGLVLQAVHDFVEAQRAFDRATELNPAHLEARVLAADWAARTGRNPVAAIRSLIAVRNMVGASYLPSVVLSRAYQGAGVCEESQKWAKSAKGDVGKYPEQAEASIELSASLLQCARPAQSQERDALLTQAHRALDGALEALARIEGKQTGCETSRWILGIGLCPGPERRHQADRLRRMAFMLLAETELLAGHDCPARAHLDEAIHGMSAAEQERAKATLTRLPNDAPCGGPVAAPVNPRLRSANASQITAATLVFAPGVFIGPPPVARVLTQERQELIIDLLREIKEIAGNYLDQPNAQVRHKKPGAPTVILTLRIRIQSSGVRPVATFDDGSIEQEIDQVSLGEEPKQFQIPRIHQLSSGYWHLVIVAESSKPPGAYLGVKSVPGPSALPGLHPLMKYVVVPGAIAVAGGLPVVRAVTKPTLGTTIRIGQGVVTP